MIQKQLTDWVDAYRESYGWRARLARYRRNLDKLPDQRRVVTRTEGNTKTTTEGPRASIERAIQDAERAGVAGDLDAFAQAMERIVADFWRAGVEILPEVRRDRKRQAGTRKPRFPECDGWMDQQLRVQPDVKAPTLWQRAPDWITDRIGYDRFKKRVTAARKRARSAASK